MALGFVATMGRDSIDWKTSGARQRTRPIYFLLPLVSETGCVGAGFGMNSRAVRDYVDVPLLILTLHLARMSHPVPVLVGP